MLASVTSVMRGWIARPIRDLGSGSRLRALSLSLILGISCSGPASEVSTRHPTAQNLIAPDGVVRVVYDTVMVIDSLIEAFADRIRDAKINHEIGRADGDPRYVFSAVEDVAIDGFGRVVVLDSRLNEVRVFENDGTHRFDYSSTAPGPDQLRAPFGVEMLSPQRPVILDRGRLLRQFSSMGDRWVPVTTTPLPVVPEGVCLSQGNVVVRGWTPEGVLHVLDSTGTTRAFGEAYVDPNATVRSQLSDGMLGCSRSGILIEALEYVPIVRAHSASGKLLWTLRLDSFQSMEISVRTSPATSISYEMGAPFDIPVALVPIDAELFVLQIARLQRGENATKVLGIRTYLLTSRGAARYVTSHLPVIGAARLPFLYGMSNDPFSRILVLKVPEASRAK